MTATKTNLTKHLKAKLGSDPRWALRALVVVFQNQTASEQTSERTVEHNGAGFSGVDAEILSSFAKQYSKSGSLSPKQMTILFKRIPRYAGQVYTVADSAKLAASFQSTQNN